MRPIAEHIKFHTQRAYEDTLSQLGQWHIGMLWTPIPEILATMVRYDLRLSNGGAR